MEKKPEDEENPLLIYFETHDCLHGTAFNIILCISNKRQFHIFAKHGRLQSPPVNDWGSSSFDLLPPFWNLIHGVPISQFQSTGMEPLRLKPALLSGQLLRLDSAFGCFWVGPLVKNSLLEYCSLAI